MLGASAHPTTIARVKIEHDRQIEPAATSADIRDVAHPRRVRRSRIELASQDVVRNRQVVPAVGGMTELATPACTQLQLPHERSCALAPQLESLSLHRLAQPATAIGVTTSFERRKQMHLLWRDDARLGATSLSGVKA